MRKLLGRVEDELASIAAPMVWLFSNAPVQVLNAITALMPALVILMVFHALVLCANAISLHDLIGLN